MDRDELVQQTLRPFIARMDAAGITEDLIIRKLKAELKAKSTKQMKIKGAVDPKRLGRGRRVVATSGTVHFDQDGNQIGGDGDAIIEWDEVAWNIRQAARIDAQKLMGLYPKQDIDVNLRGSVTVALTPEDRAMLLTSLPDLHRQIVEEHLDDPIG